MFQHVKLSVKLWLGFFAILSLMIVTAVIGINRVSLIDAKLMTVSEEAARKQRYAINFRGSVHDRAISIRDAYMALDDASMEKHLADVAQLDAFYQDSAGRMKKVFQQKNGSPQELELLEAINQIEQQTLTLTEKIVALRKNQQLDNARLFLIQDVSPAYSEWLKRINAFIDYQEQMINQDVSLVQQIANGFSELMLMITLAAVGIGCAISFWLVRDVNKRLGADPTELQTLAVAVAAGQLDIHVPHVSAQKSVLAAMVAMLDTLRKNRDIAEEIQIKDQELAAERTKQAAIEALRLKEERAKYQADAQLERKRTEEILRIKQALDVASTSVMIANDRRVIIYLNKIMLENLRNASHALRQAIPQFSPDSVMGASLDMFIQQAKPSSNQHPNNSSSQVTNLSVADLHFNLTETPIFDDNKRVIGTVLEWQDRTVEVQAEQEISQVVAAALEGNFDKKINATNKTGFMALMADGLNQLTDTTSTSLTDISRVLKAIAAGDLTERVTKNYQGAFETLKLGCNETAEHLAQMLAEIRTAAETINQASGEISQGNLDLSSRTEQQVSSLEETTSSMEELTSTVRQNADNARQANSLAAKASDVALEGGSLIDKVVDTMASINESAQKISDIIGVIDGIAFQTNILALNAAVEAARAGEQGRGFAVVASEVRTLAQRSANAAKDIKALISDSVNKINNGNELVGKSGNTMKEIVTSIKRVNDIMAEIAAASSEQSAGLDEVGKAISQMDAMTQQNAALVEKASASAESLLSQAEQLANNVARFRLDESNALLLKTSSNTSIARRVSKAAVVPSVVKTKAKSVNAAKPVDDEWETF